MQFTRTLLLPIMPIVFAIAVSQPCHADWVDKDQYPIDKETNKLLDTNASTGEQSAAWDAAYKKWDADMNVQYKKLSAMLKPEERKTLQTSQLQWLKWRDAELKVIDAVYAHTSGSMFAPMNAASNVRIVRDRAVLLRHYISLVKGL